MIIVVTWAWVDQVEQVVCQKNFPYMAGSSNPWLSGNGRKFLRPPRSYSLMIVLLMNLCCYFFQGVVKPDIVFFGEDLPKKFYSYIVDFPKCDLLLIMGTSLEVRATPLKWNLFSFICPRVNQQIVQKNRNRLFVLPLFWEWLRVLRGGFYRRLAFQPNMGHNHHSPRRFLSPHPSRQNAPWELRQLF